MVHQTLRIEVLNNKEVLQKIKVKSKNVLFVKRETLFDSVVANKDFAFHAINGCGEQSDGTLVLEHTLYMIP